MGRPSWPKRMPAETTLMAASPEAAVLEVDVPAEAKEASADESPNARLSGMALMLDDGTRKSHSVAESTQFVTGFFKGLADKDSYRALITSLYFVYAAMEKAMDNTIEERVKDLDYEHLRRLTSLERDMDFFYG